MGQLVDSTISAYHTHISEFSLICLNPVLLTPLGALPTCVAQAFVDINWQDFAILLVCNEPPNASHFLALSFGVCWDLSLVIDLKR